MKQLIFLILLIFIRLITISQNAPSIVEVKGQIVDSLTKEKIPYATISISRIPGKNAERRVAADLDGKFSTTLKNSGDYQATINCIGYIPYNKKFKITSGQTQMDFGMIFMSVQSKDLSEINIVAEKPLVKVEADKITYSLEVDPETKTSTALDMLRKVPLVSVDGEDNIQLKGSSDFKIFFDGKPSTMMSNNPKDVLKNMPANLIKDIEVITSPGAKYDAEGVGGIINIVTAKKTLQGYTVSINAGANNQGSANGGINTSAMIGKLGFSANVMTQYRNSRYFESTTYRDNFLFPEAQYSNWIGKSKNIGLYPFGNGEISYEIDTLNLISASFNFWGGKNENKSESEVDVSKKSNELTQAYLMNTNNISFFGGPEANIDYQHTFRKNKEQIMTLSYKINYQPNNNSGESSIDSIFNYASSKQKTDNEAYSREQTFQTDYVQPIVKNHKLEMGVKAILRKNFSETNYEIYDFQLNQYVADASRISNLDYKQNILAGYLSYNGKYEKISYKAGLRIENTNTEGTFTSKQKTDFTNQYLEYIPSGSISYQLAMTQTARFSYSLRIQRPNIYYLNPYINDLDPKNISFGNPNLDAERVHSFDFNYSFFAKITNFNFSAYHSLSNNSIERVTTIQPEGGAISTFENVGKNRIVGFSLYGSLKIGKNFNANINTSANYRDIKNQDDSNMKTSGWGYNFHSNLTYNLGKGFKASASGGFFKPPVRLQVTTTSFYFLSFSLRKEMLKNKLTLSLQAQNIFWDKMKMRFEVNDASFYQNSINYRPGRSFGFNISYKFGEMKSQIKKVEHGIKNDDVKSGESNESNGN